MFRLPDALVRFLPVIFLAGAVFSCHLLFSPLGFNPTDDGFTLGYARRIAEGEFPHRDFIAIRPMLSPVMHLPEVLFNKEMTYLLSRFFVWSEWAVIAGIWAWILCSATFIPLASTRTEARPLAGIIIFTLSAHSFPVTAWHTIDGLFLLSLGALLWRFRTKNLLFFVMGYVLLAAAALCKQSFAFIAPVFILLGGDRKRPAAWTAAFLPATCYFVILAFGGAIGEGVTQLTAATGFFAAGIKGFVLSGTIPCFLTVALVGGQRFSFVTQNHPLLAAIMVVIAAGAMCFGFGAVFQTSFGLFGIACGIGFLLWRRDGLSEQVAVITTVVIIAWSAALSLGYNSPALFTGELAVLILVVGLSRLNRRAFRLWASVLTLICAVSFVLVRMQIIYRQPSASSLTYSLGGILPGAKGIFTDERTYIALRELTGITRAAREAGNGYVILPDCAGWWAAAAERNQLPADWLYRTEISTAPLHDRVAFSLGNLPQNTVIIAQKFDAARLSEGIFPPDSARYPILRELQRLQCIKETPFFRLLRSAPRR